MNRRAVLWIVVAVLTLMAFGATLAFSETPPPTRVVLATGAPGGAYIAVGHLFADRLREWHGPTVTVLQSRGSVDNLHMLIEHRADVALVQGGIVSSVLGGLDVSHLRAIARIYSEPLWVFYRSSDELHVLSDLRSTDGGQRHRIAIGEDGSGTEPIARDLLRVNGVNDANATLIHMRTPAAIDALVRGDIDVLFDVGTPNAPNVQRLLHLPGVRPMNFNHSRGYARRLPYLSTVDIEQGQLSLEDNIPSQDLTLLAPSATLVTRDDAHPRVVEMFTKAAEQLFGPGDLIDLPGEYPSSRGLELPQHEAARRYIAEGESWALRHLPFWAILLVDRAKLILIPVGTVALSALQGMPFVLTLRVRRMVSQRYERLRQIEARARRAKDKAELQPCLRDIDELHAETARLAESLSSANQEIVFGWRMHAALVRQRVADRLAAFDA